MKWSVGIWLFNYIYYICMNMKIHYELMEKIVFSLKYLIMKNNINKLLMEYYTLLYSEYIIYKIVFQSY